MSVETRTEDGCRVVAVVTDVTAGLTSCDSRGGDGVVMSRDGAYAAGPKITACTSDRRVERSPTG